MSENANKSLSQANDSEIPLLPGTARFTVTSGYTNAETNRLGKRVLQITSVIFLLNVFTKLIVVIAEGASGGDDLDWAVLDFILTLFFAGFLLWVAITGVQKRNPDFCLLGALEWYLLVTVMFAAFSFIGFIAGCVGGRVALILPSIVFFAFNVWAIYEIIQFLKCLNNDGDASSTSS
eukprot:g1470.t1